MEAKIEVGEKVREMAGTMQEQVEEGEEEEGQGECKSDSSAAVGKRVKSLVIHGRVDLILT